METPQLKELEPIGGEHGISSVYPTLQDIIDFKNGRVKVNRGYPRFVMHPYLREWTLKTVPGAAWFWPVDTRESAEFMIRRYCRLSPDKITVTGDSNGAVLSVETEADYTILYDDIRNTGFTMSSRKAARLLDERLVDERSHTPRPADEKGAPERHVRESIASYEEGASADATWLFPSGMAATFMAYLAAFRAEKPDLVVIGNPYYDTRLLFQRYAARNGLSEPVFAETDGEWEAAVTDRTGIIFLELPTNPLVRTADLEKIISLARTKDIRVLVDNTLATSFNSAPLRLGADAVIQSTTKFLNGMNDHIGGVVMLNARCPAGIRDAMTPLIEEANCHLDPEETAVLESNLGGFPARMAKINRNALVLARYLENHPAVARVYYPSLASHPDHKIAARLLSPGAGGVLSFTLKGSSLAAATAFYDHCTLSGKGPSLGGEQTLLCPITLLTFFAATDAELDAMGLDRYLFRISAGIEEPQTIIDFLESGLRLL